MSEPTEQEIDNWRRDVDLLLDTMKLARRDEPHELSDFSYDLHLIIRSLVKTTRLMRPIAPVFRMVRRLGYAISPEATPSQARRLGRLVLRQLRSQANVFEVKVRDDWISKKQANIAKYDHACIATFFVERVHNLSKPGGVARRHWPRAKSASCSWRVGRARGSGSINPKGCFPSGPCPGPRCCRFTLRRCWHSRGATVCRCQSM